MKGSRTCKGKLHPTATGIACMTLTSPYLFVSGCVRFGKLSRKGLLVATPKLEVTGREEEGKSKRNGTNDISSSRQQPSRPPRIRAHGSPYFPNYDETEQFRG